MIFRYFIQVTNINVFSSKHILNSGMHSSNNFMKHMPTNGHCGIFWLVTVQKITEAGPTFNLI